MRLSLAIPVFVRGVNGQGREFVEFCTLLNESAGGALLAIRRPLRRWSRVSLEMPFSTGSGKCGVSTNGTYTEGPRCSNHAHRRRESMWITICPGASVVIQRID